MTIPAKLDFNIDLAPLHKKLEIWRLTKKPQSRIPSSIWNEACRLAQTHGCSKVATALQLDLKRLRQRMKPTNPDGPASEFVEAKLMVSPERRFGFEVTPEGQTSYQLRIYGLGPDAIGNLVAQLGGML